MTMKLKPQLLDFLSGLSIFQNARERRALIDCLGLGNLANRIEWEGNAFTFVILSPSVRVFKDYEISFASA